MLSPDGAVSEVVIRAPAKLNVALSVLGRRDDGYHEIDSLMVAVTLHDTLRVRPLPPGEDAVRLRVRFEGRLASAAGRPSARDVPDDDRNLAIRAARVLAIEAGVTRGLEIDLVKRIPSQAGLGGGSSDAAAALRAAAKAWGLRFTDERLAAFAASIGSDVPWFFAGRPAIARGRGERIEPVADVPAWPVVIAVPEVGLSTAEIYRRCRPEPSRHRQSKELAGALAVGDFAAATRLMHNTLEAAALEVCPHVSRLLAAMRKAGAIRPMVTGSGSGCFTLARSMVESRRIAARLDAEGWPYVFCGRFLPNSRLRPAITHRGG